MRYLFISFIIFCVSFSISLLASFIKNRFAFISSILSYLGISVVLMKKFDVSYFNELFTDIENINLYLFVSACLVLIITVTEAIFMKNNRKKIEVVSLEPVKEKVYIERDTKIYYFNLINIAIAYYNEKKQNYVLNNAFRKLLEIDEIEISLEKLKEYISSDTIDEFDCGKAFKINNEWFELKQELIAEETYKIITKIDNKLGSNANVGNYKDLENIVKESDSKGIEYGLVLSNIYSILELVPTNKYNLTKTSKDVREKELRDVIVAKYLTKILNGDLKDKVKIYRLGSNEYAFYLTDKNSYDFVERQLLTNQSEFISSDIIINDKTYTISAKVGIVFASYVNKTSTSVINACFDTLQLVVSSTYKKDYCIYQNSLDDKVSYKLSDMGIDLDNDIKKFY